MPPANTDSDDEEEPAQASNNGPATSRSRPRSPWTTDKSSDSEGHADNTEASQLTSVEAKAAIQYPITPESSLVCTKEELPCLDSTVISPGELPENLVSGMLLRVHDQGLNWNLQLAAHYTTTLGVIVLGVAAAAVRQCVKPGWMLVVLSTHSFLHMVHFSS